MDKRLTQPSFSAILFFPFQPNDWNIQPFSRAGKQFIYLIPYDSDLNHFYLSAVLKSSTSGEYMLAQCSLPRPFSDGQAWLVNLDKAQQTAYLENCLLFPFSINFLFHSLFILA